MPDPSGSVTATVLNIQISEAENKIPSVSGLLKKKQIMTLKRKTLTENISLLLIIINLQMAYFI